MNKRKPNVALTTSGGRTVAHTARALLQLGRAAMITHPSFCAQKVAEKGCRQALVCCVCQLTKCSPRIHFERSAPIVSAHSLTSPLLGRKSFDGRRNIRPGRGQVRSEAFERGWQPQLRESHLLINRNRDLASAAEAEVLLVDSGSVAVSLGRRATTSRQPSSGE